MAKDSTRYTVTIVINGTPSTFEFSPHEGLHGVVSSALGRTGNVGQPPENWILTNVAGTELDLSAHLEDYVKEDGATLFLNPRAAIGG